jgi:hypothetical protein
MEVAVPGDDLFDVAESYRTRPDGRPSLFLVCTEWDNAGTTNVLVVPFDAYRGDPPLRRQDPQGSVPSS